MATKVYVIGNSGWNSMYEEWRGGIGVFYGDDDDRNESLMVRGYAGCDHTVEALAIRRALRMNLDTLDLVISTGSIACHDTLLQLMQPEVDVAKLGRHAMLNDCMGVVAECMQLIRNMREKGRLPNIQYAAKYEPSHGSFEADRLARHAANSCKGIALCKIVNPPIETTLCGDITIHTLEEDGAYNECTTKVVSKHRCASSSDGMQSGSEPPDTDPVLVVIPDSDDSNNLGGPGDLPINVYVTCLQCNEIVCIKCPKNHRLLESVPIKPMWDSIMILTKCRTCTDNKLSTLRVAVSREAETLQTMRSFKALSMSVNMIKGATVHQRVSEAEGSSVSIAHSNGRICYLSIFDINQACNSSCSISSIRPSEPGHTTDQSMHIFYKMGFI